MPWILLALASAAAVLGWRYRRELTRTVLFDGLSRLIQDQLETLEIAPLLPAPVSSYPFPAVDIFVRDIKYTHPSVILKSTGAGVEFSIQLENLVIDLWTEGVIRAEARATAQRVIILGHVLLMPDLSYAEAPVQVVSVLSFLARIEQKDAFGVAALIASSGFQRDLQDKVEEAIREGIETQVPLLVLEYAQEYPGVAMGLIGLIETAGDMSS